MKYIVVIKPDDKIELEPYENFKSIEKCVEGYFEFCGHLPAADGSRLDVYCNEQGLLINKCTFNATATLLMANHIYGNIALLLRGYNDDGEIDSLPLDEEKANVVVTVLKLLQGEFAPTLKFLHEQYDNAPKPEPSLQVFKVCGDDLRKMFGIK